MLTANCIFDPANKALVESIIEIKACGKTDATDYAPYIVDSMCARYPELELVPNAEEIESELKQMVIEYLMKYEDSDVYWNLSGGLHITEIRPLPLVERNKAVILDTVAVDCWDKKTAYVVRGAKYFEQAVLELEAAIGYDKFRMLHFVAATKIDCVEHIYEVLQESGEYTIRNQKSRKHKKK
jgi:hypothetical protein